MGRRRVVMRVAVGVEAGVLRRRGCGWGGGISCRLRSCVVGLVAGRGRGGGWEGKGGGGRVLCGGVFLGAARCQ